MLRAPGGVTIEAMADGANGRVGSCRADSSRVRCVVRAMTTKSLSVSSRARQANLILSTNSLRLTACSIARNHKNRCGVCASRGFVVLCTRIFLAKVTFPFPTSRRCAAGSTHSNNWRRWHPDRAWSPAYSAAQSALRFECHRRSRNERRGSHAATIHGPCSVQGSVPSGHRFGTRSRSGD